MKIIRVVAAVICDKDKVFATARGYGEFKGYWEFPGGKIEPGETPSQALSREIMEELNIKIEILDSLGCVEYDYESFHLSMECFRVRKLSGEIHLNEAEDGRWLRKNELLTVKWLPADQMLLDKIAEEI